MTVRLGFIGAGNWAMSNHMPVLKARDDVRFEAVCTLGADALAQVQARFGFPFATEDYRELLDRSLDAVVISTPPTLHYAQALAALERGLHVMVEKPLAVRADDARALVDDACRRKLHLLVPYGWHYKPMLLKAKSLMPLVGHVEHVQAHMASALRAIYSGEGWAYSSDDTPDPDSRTYSDPATAGGGQGVAQLSHLVGMALWLTGLRAGSVFALMSGPGARVDLYDALTVRFAGGAIGTISGAGTLPTSRPRHQVDLRIFGSEGVLLLDLERERLEVLRSDGAHVQVDVAPGEGAYVCDGPPNRFIDLILGKSGENLSPGDVAADAVALMDAAYRSAASGRMENV